MIPTLFVDHLTSIEILTLEELHRNHSKPVTRTRAHVILLSNRGYSISELEPIFNLTRQALAKAINRWEKMGICGLFDRPRAGRPRKLSEKQEAFAIKKIHETPRSLKSVLHEIEKNMRVHISKSTLKRLCKQAGLVWKRVRKSLKSKRSEEAFERSKTQIEKLILQEKEGEIDLFYFDESGFTLTPVVPYAWQKIGQAIELPSSRSNQLNVLGFVNRRCEFKSFVFEGSVNTDVVVACIDQFANQITKPTTLIIDNAPTHTSKKFLAQFERWGKLGLTITPISPYSPELNIIEIVWRKIKYEWLPLSSYESYGILEKNLFNILANIGKEFHIKFS